MSKKITQNRDFYAHLLFVKLMTECKERDDEPKNAGSGGDNGTIKLDTLHAVLSSKAAVMKKSLTFIGYLEVILALFKIAFLGKIRNGKTPTFWLFSSE